MTWVIWRTCLKLGSRCASLSHWSELPSLKRQTRTRNANRLTCMHVGQQQFQTPKALLSVYFMEPSIAQCASTGWRSSKKKLTRLPNLARGSKDGIASRKVLRPVRNPQKEPHFINHSTLQAVRYALIVWPHTLSVMLHHLHNLIFLSSLALPCKSDTLTSFALIRSSNFGSIQHETFEFEIEFVYLSVRLGATELLEISDKTANQRKDPLFIFRTRKSKVK